MILAPVPRSALRQVAEWSLVDCHARGVDSVVFQKHPIVRAFIAHRGHTLWQNISTETFSVGFHNHHCGVRLAAIFGEAWNIGFHDGGDGLRVSAWQYASPIMGKAGRFVSLGQSKAVRPYARLIGREGLVLPAEEFHTVWVHRDHEAAWLVEEGEEDPGYCSVNWTNADLTHWSAEREGLYRPMSEERLALNLARMCCAVDWSL